jgi:hypothetical protein
MTKFEDIDTDKSGSIEKSEWDALLLDDKRRQIDDEDSKRDQQRKMVWFALIGMLIYPLTIIITAIAGLTEATAGLTSIAGVYFIAVSAIVGAFFGFTNTKKKDDF